MMDAYTVSVDCSFLCDCEKSKPTDCTFLLSHFFPFRPYPVNATYFFLVDLFSSPGLPHEIAESFVSSDSRMGSLCDLHCRTMEWINSSRFKYTIHGGHPDSIGYLVTEQLQRGLPSINDCTCLFSLVQCHLCMYSLYSGLCLQLPEVFFAENARCAGRRRCSQL